MPPASYIEWRTGWLLMWACIITGIVADEL
jgi:hypothetical protein